VSEVALVRGSTDRLRLDWQDGWATGPDGTQYMIQTENPLHEPVRHSPHIKPVGAASYHALLTQNRGCPYGYSETKTDAKRCCEWDAWDRAGRPA
jgi:hypothetical protein